MPIIHDYRQIIMTDAPLTLPAAFLIGLFSTLHCIGMCGSIMGALSLGLPASIRDNRFRRFSFVSSYNLGRILSYSLAGLVTGALGAGLLEHAGLATGHSILRTTGAAMMIVIGLYLAGWLPQLAYFERAGAPVWRKLEPIGRKMMPVDTMARAFVYGMIWGWLPCGLVYTVLLWTLTAGSALEGALTMMAFGIGTLPTLIATGMMASWLTRFAQSTHARRLVGLLIILLAIGSLFLPFGAEHSQHVH